MGGNPARPCTTPILYAGVGRSTPGGDLEVEVRHVEERVPGTVRWLPMGVVQVDRRRTWCASKVYLASCASPQGFNFSALLEVTDTYTGMSAI